MPGTTPSQQLPYPVPGDTVDVPRDVKALADKLDPLGYAPIGGMMMWPGAAAPDGWLLMQGQTNIPAANYPQLALILGQTAGMLNMPDMRDRVPLGSGGEAALKATGGQRNTQLLAHNHTEANAGSHSHGGFTGDIDRSIDHVHSNPPSGFFAVSPHPGILPVAVNVGAGPYWAIGANGSPITVAPSLVTGTATTPLNHLHVVTADGVHTHAINNTGAAAPDNRPPFVAVNFIIRAG